MDYLKLTASDQIVLLTKTQCSVNCSQDYFILQAALDVVTQHLILYLSQTLENEVLRGGLGKGFGSNPNLMPNNHPELIHSQFTAPGLAFLFLLGKTHKDSLIQHSTASEHHGSAQR